MDSTRRQSRQQRSIPIRAIDISRTKYQLEVNLDFSDRMARAKAAMLAKEHKYNPNTVLIPEIIITPSLDPIMELDDEKP